MANGQHPPAKIRKKSSAGVIGFALGVSGVGCFGLSGLPGLVFCLIGIFRKSYRIFSWIGLLICLFDILLVSVWTPPGSIPYPISIAKYCMNAPSFWVGYDVLHLRKAQSQYWLFGGAGGALYFKASKPGTFDPNEVIVFAERHNWHFQDKLRFTADDFAKFLNEKGNVIYPDIKVSLDKNLNYEETERLYVKLYEEQQKRVNTLSGMTMYDGGFTLWIQQDCTIFSFDTGNRIGSLSRVSINHEGTEMAVYYNGIR